MTATTRPTGGTPRMYSIAVYEKASYWAPGLRLALLDEPAAARPAVRECRIVDDLLAMAAESPDGAPAMLAVLEATRENLPAVVAALRSLRRRKAPAIVATQWIDCRWLAREAGAIHVVLRRGQLHCVAAIARRHQARLASLAASRPAPSASRGVRELQQAIWRRLPWQANPK